MSSNTKSQEGTTIRPSRVLCRHFRRSRGRISVIVVRRRFTGSSRARSSRSCDINIGNSSSGSGDRVLVGGHVNWATSSGGRRPTQNTATHLNNGPLLLARTHIHSSRWGRVRRDSRWEERNQRFGGEQSLGKGMNE